MNPSSSHEDVGFTAGLAQWVRESGVAVSCGVGRRCDLDPVLLWLWRRPAATALIRPLAWEPPICHRSGPRKGKKKKYQNASKPKKVDTVHTSTF